MFEFRKFVNNLFGSVRTLYSVEAGILFVAKDIAEILGYTRTNAMLRLLFAEDVIEKNPQTLEITGLLQNGATQFEPNLNIKRMVFITEAGLYAAIFGSKKEVAKDFKKWICSEVLPSIRKNGGYIEGQELLKADEKNALLAEVKKLSEQVSVLKKEQNALDDCITVWEEMFDKIYKDYKALVDKSKTPAVVGTNESACEYIVTADGLVMPKWVLTY